MAALQFDLNLTLDVNQNGLTAKIINEALAESAQAASLSTSQFLTIATGVSNQAVSLGGITTVTLMLMLSDQPLTVKINGETTGHLCKNLLLTDAAITAITLSNASGSTASPRICLLG